MVAKDALNRIAEAIQIIRLGPAIVEPGQPVLARLMPPTHELNALDPLQEVAGVQIPPELLALLPTGMAGSLTGNLTGGAVGAPTGFAGNFTGDLVGNTVPSVPVDIPVRLPVRIPLTIRVEWSATRENGTQELSDDECIKLDRPDAPSEAAFLFAPPIRELTTHVDPEKPQYLMVEIRARVMLDTGIPDPEDSTKTIASDWQAILPIQLELPYLSIPTIVAFFMHKNFVAWDLDEGPGAALVVTPYDCPLRKIEDVQSELRTLEPIISRLSMFGRFALFLAGLQSFSSALSSHPNLRFISRDAIPNLNKIKLIDKDVEYEVGGVPIPGTDVGNDIEAEDEFSSIIVIGPPPVLVRVRIPPGPVSGKKRKGVKIPQPIPELVWRYRTVECFNRRDYKTSKGHMRVSVGLEMCALIADLHRVHDNSDAPPASIPSDRIRVLVEAPGPPEIPADLPDISIPHGPSINLDAFLGAIREDGFGDRLSSMKFSRTTQV